MDASRLGLDRPVTTWGASNTESIGNSFEGYVQQGYKTNGVIFAVILARMLLFTEARFQFQQLDKGRPGNLFGNTDLALLETPWPNGTTGDLLARMEQDASLAGNAFIARRFVDRQMQLRRLRPDRVDIILGSVDGTEEGIDARPLGYLHWSNGYRSGKPTTLLLEDVAHFAPIPDPTALFRGMSWLTPIAEEIRSDTAATRHKGRFFDNAATPNLAVALNEAVPKNDALELIDAMSEHEGVDNAYKTLWLAGGADVKVVGADLKQLDFKVTQGAGETRIAAAGGVPPVIVGLSEGLQQATYSNYGQARRKFGDGWARPQWRMAAACLQKLIQTPAGSRLWYDDRDISFLQEDQKDAAEILKVDAESIRTLTDGGYTPDSVVAAVQARNPALLVHSGLIPVQLQSPDANGTPTPRSIAETVQKLYLGVDVVLSADEARKILEDAGAPISGPMPEPSTGGGI